MVVALLASIALAYMIVRSISKPMTLMADGAKRIASGDLTVEEFRVKHRDEIGALAKAFNQMVDSLRNVINQVKDGAENVSAASQQISAATEQMASGSMSCDFHNYLS
nr:methyl-accepting chemotaxis protein [Alicyclobacillus dauci]